MSALYMPRKFVEKSLVIASHNAGKISEIKAILSSHPIKISDAATLDLDEPEENGGTYLENALIKARACVLATNLAVLADDSGIEVEALGNQPGVDTAPFTKKSGGREKVFALWQANKKIQENPRAAFICYQVLMWPDGHYEAFNARVPGRLTFPPQGADGHGYDPVFIPDNLKRTMAELSFAEKNNYSHRAQALRKLVEACFDR
jgi:XTP/dITP diphosphohydrolase